MIRSQHLYAQDDASNYSTHGQPDNRHAVLAEVRMIIDGLDELCASVRASWPLRYPIPPELDALLNFQDYALQRVRNGALKQFACNAENPSGSVLWVRKSA